MGVSAWDWVKLLFGVWPAVAFTLGMTLGKFMRAGKGRDDIQTIEDYANAGGVR